MLLGFYPPAKGEITLGGINLNNYNIRQWRKKCGIVMQDGFIFLTLLPEISLPE